VYYTLWNDFWLRFCSGIACYVVMQKFSYKPFPSGGGAHFPWAGKGSSVTAG